MICLYEELGSTSQEALDLLSQGVRPPFAVQSLSQKNGRGQLGRFWQSPPGHLYISFALPLYDLCPEKIALLPLAFGGWVAEFLLARFGLRVFLKWPNDLFYAGCKLGGVLCEASVIGSQLNHLVVGLGINILPVENSGQLEQRAIGLGEIVARPPTAISLGQDIARKVFMNWSPSWSAAAVTVFHKFSLPRGTPVLYQKHWRSFAGISIGGSLLLKDTSSSGVIELASGREKIFWGPFLDNYIYAIADIGNSALKLAVYRGREVAPIWSASADWEHLLGQLMQLKNFLPEGGVVYCCSVNPGRAASLNSWAKASGYRIIDLPKRLLRLKTPYPLKQLGVDRLASMEAVLAANANKRFMIASFGTATTIDTVDESGIHLGGYILAGISGQLEAIGNKGALLPAIKVEDFDSVTAQVELGYDTSSAIILGLKYSIRATVERLMSEYRITASNLFLTGGHRKVVSFDGACDFPNAVIKGVREFVLGGSI